MATELILSFILGQRNVVTQNFKNQAQACKEAEAESSNPTMDQNAYRQQDQIQR